MTESVVKQRNQYLDIIRGMAMLLVILGHTMSGCTQNSQKSFVFNIVWSLQMPLFILVSGYVTRYSRAVSNFSILGACIKKRTIAYLFPWIVWTMLIRGAFLGNYKYLDPKYIFWNMDSGYWFLITIWTINVVFLTASFLSAKLAGGKRHANVFAEIFRTGVFYVIGMAILALIGVAAGISFFGIKLTLYYMPFYFVGYAYGKLQERINTSSFGVMLTQLTIAVSTVAWLAMIAKVNLFEISDSGIGILIRAFASMTGCIAIFGLCRELFGHKPVGLVLCWYGTHSLEIYLTHNLLLVLLQPGSPLEINSIAGIIMVAVNYIVTTVLTALVVRLLSANRILRAVLYGKV